MALFYRREMSVEGNSLILDDTVGGKKIEEEEEGNVQLEEKLDSPVDSISEDEWNRSIIEVEEEFQKVRDLKSNSMELYVLVIYLVFTYRNEEYENKMDTVYKLRAEKRYEEAKQLFEEMLNGALKYRCDNAEFWICYAMIERVLNIS